LPGEARQKAQARVSGWGPGNGVLVGWSGEMEWLWLVLLVV